MGVRESVCGFPLQQVQHELALELRSAENRIEHLSQQLAISR